MLNGLPYPYTIYVGQRLVVSGSSTPGLTPPPSQQVHVVQAGDIYVGQRLVIP